MEVTKPAHVRALAEKVVDGLRTMNDIMSVYMALRVYAAILDHPGERAEAVLEDFAKTFPQPKSEPLPAPPAVAKE